MFSLLTGTYKPLPYVPEGNSTGSNADMLASDIYVVPWCRMGVYFVGMITGYILHSTNRNIRLNKVNHIT